MRLKRYLAAAILLLVPFSADAQSSQDNLINELYVKSGLEIQGQQIPGSIEAGFDQAVLQDPYLSRLQRSTIVNMREMIQDSFAPELLKKTIIQEIEANMNAETIQQVIKWLDSALGKKCTRLEEDASDPALLPEIQRFAAQLQSSPPPPRRIELIKELDQSIGATDTLVTITLNTQFAVASAIVASRPSESRPPLSEIKKQIERSRPHLEPTMKAHVLVMFLYTYQTLTDSEIEAYITFATSGTGIEYHKVTVAGYEKAMVHGSLKWGESIGTQLLESENKSET